VKFENRGDAIAKRRLIRKVPAFSCPASQKLFGNFSNARNLDDIANTLTCKGSNVAAPSVERRPLFISETMPLINSHNSAPGAGDVSEDGLDRLQAGAEALKAGRNRAAEIVNAPGRDRRAGSLGGSAVEERLCPRPPAHRSASGRRKYKITARHSWQIRDYLGGFG
jgi:hypothetical protein